MNDPTLTSAIDKLAVAGERAGFTTEHLIRLLNAGMTVEDLVQLIAHRLCAEENPPDPRETN